MLKIRQDLDYTYHKKETDDEIKIHNEIIQQMIPKTIQKNESPTIVFTAGCFGSGKSYIIRSNPLFENCIYNDPDQIKSIFSIDSHKEALLISELLTRYALEQQYNIIVDGSLKDWQWHELFFKFIKETYPAYFIHIVFVRVQCFDTIMKRAQKRCKETGRCIDLKTLENVWNTVFTSIEHLSVCKWVDKLTIVENDE